MSRIYFNGFPLFDGFDDFFNGGNHLPDHLQNSLAGVDLVELENQLKLLIDVPGMKREDIRVELDEGLLRISAKRETQTEGLRHNGRKALHFSKVFELDDTLDPQKITAKCVDGVLEVCLDKKARQDIKKIDVQ